MSLGDNELRLLSAETTPDGTAVTAGPDPLQVLIGRAECIEEVRQSAWRIARSPVPVLIRGETGTGKELVAEAIARLSGRYPFVAMNCAAIPRELAESELFGHEKGAFTGALQARVGVIEVANERTLFLDEVTELPDAVQAKLLRTLETGEYRRIGSTETRRSSFRILAATSEAVDGNGNTGGLRPALLHRICAAQIWLAPLRDRPLDIPLLAAEFLRRYREKTASGPGAITPQACAILMQEAWPGNVRQLRNVIEVAAAWAGTEPAVDFVHVLQVLEMQNKTQAASAGVVLPLAEARRRAEVRAIFEALRQSGGNREKAAGLLRISVATLYRKLANGVDMLPA